MATQAALQTELEKNKQDKILSEFELDFAKENFANQLNGIKRSTLSVKPRTYKLPFKVRIAFMWESFKDKCRIFFGI
jgi:hypothetical protein